MEMLKKVAGYLQDEQGVETLEWVAMGALIVAVAALLVYGPTGNGALPTSRSTPSSPTFQRQADEHHPVAKRESASIVAGGLAGPPANEREL